MKRTSGISNSAAGEMALLAVAVCLLAGVLAGCGDDEPSGSGSAATGQSSPVAGENQGTDESGQGSGQASAGQDRGGAPSGSGDEPGPQTGAGKIPPGLAESQLMGIGAGLPGRIGMIVSAPGGPGTQVLIGDLTAGPAFSTINLPVSERVLKDGNGPAGIDPQVRDQIDTAISRPDAKASAPLVARLESDHGGPAGASKAVGQTVRAAGDGPGVTLDSGAGPGSNPGQAIWPLGSQNRYMAALAGGCKVDAATRKFLLARMAPADGRESYGLGSTGPSARWTGGSGTGPNGAYLARQAGVFDTAGGSVVVAVMALPDDSSPETAKDMMNEVTDRLVDRLADQALPELPCPATGKKAG